MDNVATVKSQNNISLKWMNTETMKKLWVT